MKKIKPKIEGSVVDYCFVCENRGYYTNIKGKKQDCKCKEVKL